jgi:hypothetical protein
MAAIIWDIETFSDSSLKDHGAHIYAQHPSTGVHFVCFAVDDGEVQTWRPGDPVPAVFADPAGTKFVSHNWTFENAILRWVLSPRYRFASIPWESQDCAMRLALASAYPAELGLCCEALDLPYRKDVEARKAMLRLSRPQTAKKRKKPVDPAERERDLALLLERCKSDVEATRAVYRSHCCGRFCRKNASFCYSTPRSTSAAFTPMCRFSEPSAISPSGNAMPSTCGSMN